MKTFAKLLMAFLMVFNAQGAAAQEWNAGARATSWIHNPVLGDNSNAQGGNPPALSYEPAAINENGNYVASSWFGGSASWVSLGEGKFRTECDHSHFEQADPILYFEQANAGHLHDFIGNTSTDENSTYATLRNSPTSTCDGGPLNGTGYWEPALMYEVDDDVFVPVKPNVITFYYQVNAGDVTKTYRIPRGMAFIGGVDPNDRLNTARLAELSATNPLGDGTSWKVTGRRYNGWAGWACYNGGTLIPLAVGNTADVETAGYARQLVNDDGTDPWGGACEDPGYNLIANMSSPSCWDGHNLTSPNGRDHFRYPAVRNQDQNTSLCPNGWWRIPHFEVKTNFANGRYGGTAGHAYRSKLHLSSDRMDPNPANWHPRGSTFHFDWMNGWDYDIMNIWMGGCVGVTLAGVAGTPLTCNDSTISSTQKMYNNTTLYSYYDDPAKDAFGPVTTGEVVDAHVEHAY